MISIKDCTLTVKAMDAVLAIIGMYRVLRSLDIELKIGYCCLFKGD